MEHQGFTTIEPDSTVSDNDSEPVVVLDRDGTIVLDRDYLDDPDGLEFLPGAAEGLRRLCRSGHRLIIISNQSGVGRGFFSLGRLAQVNARLLDMVRAAGADLAGVYCCPHLPEEGCGCRKPGTQLLLQAASELGFDPKAAIVIGDKQSDVELGRRVGAVTILISNNPHSKSTADHIAPNLTAAAEIIEKLGGTAVR